jgi:SAM-dependent methyltransferase
MSTASRIESSSTMSDAIKTAGHYHHWVFSSFRDFIQPGTALEVGSGHGKYARHIAPLVDRLVVSDIDPTAVDAIEKELADISHIDCMVMDGIDSTVFGGELDNVVLVNLLEHIEDDSALLADARASLRKGGALIIFVPAFQALFSTMDEQAGHFRRYQRGALVKLVEGAGFQVKRCRYFNALGFLGWYANKLTKSTVNSTTTNLQVSLYNRAIPLLRHIDRVVPFFGQSLVLVAHKR